MNNPRRQFLKSLPVVAGTPLVIDLGQAFHIISGISSRSGDFSNQDPVLKTKLFPDPVIIDRLELLRYEDNFICRVTSTDGAEGLAVSNNFQMVYLYPIFTALLQDFFIGKDVREWEQLLEEVYVYKSNYKLQNLALWVPLVTIEFAVLDMLGKIAGKPIGELIGEIYHL